MSCIFFALFWLSSVLRQVLSDLALLIVEINKHMQHLGLKHLTTKFFCGFNLANLIVHKRLWHHLGECHNDK